jgi:hypothetical protein
MKGGLRTLFDRPLIILAAPRSGSTLLFETLAEAPGVWTVGGESHSLIEGIRQLNPRSGRVDSNRLEAVHASPAVRQRVRQRFAQALRDRDGQRYGQDRPIRSLRFLEKTPKNALRQPFLEQVFPGALYLYLYREPRGNLSSMMEAWKSGRWVTYPRLPGWRGPPWSLLLPPGWQALSGRPLAEICAFQWATANRMILEDLESLDADRWMACSYDDLTGDAAGIVERICRFAGLEMDGRMKRLLQGDLPLSRYTHTPPDPDKWRRNESGILPVLDSIEPVRERCEAALGRGRN